MTNSTLISKSAIVNIHNEIIHQETYMMYGHNIHHAEYICNKNKVCDSKNKYINTQLTEEKLKQWNELKNRANKNSLTTQ